MPPAGHVKRKDNILKERESLKGNAEEISGGGGSKYVKRAKEKKKSITGYAEGGVMPGRSASSRTVGGGKRGNKYRKLPALEGEEGAKRHSF